eukprot:TRINITY_DN973_c0_g2_i1.p1 TRINITY_DN973_c0_g2~~TRINITY_DN973_c0_g2_i1.p1  ORF type:complete len:234 (-),score=71.41 TRINITY_DN973_c0_g2_i1:1310-2011(-)
MEYDDINGFPANEEETLTSAGPLKPIEELNDDSIRLAFSKLPVGVDKVLPPQPQDSAIQSGTVTLRDTFTRLAPDQKAQVVELGPRKATDYGGDVSGRLQRIERELGKIEREVRALEEARNKQKAKKVDFEAKALDEVEKIRRRMGELVKSKGYQELIQWEGETSGLSSMGLNENLTESLLGAVSVSSCKLHRPSPKREKKERREKDCGASCIIATTCTRCRIRIDTWSLRSE